MRVQSTHHSHFFSHFEDCGFRGCHPLTHDVPGRISGGRGLTKESREHGGRQTSQRSSVPVVLTTSDQATVGGIQLALPSVAHGNRSTDPGRGPDTDNVESESNSCTRSWRMG